MLATTPPGTIAAGTDVAATAGAVGVNTLVVGTMVVWVKGPFVTVTVCEGLAVYVAVVVGPGTTKVVLDVGTVV